jgi:hypothetical protein
MLVLFMDISFAAAVPADGLFFPGPTMVTVIIPLHERLGPAHGDSGVEPLTIGVIGMADEQVSDIRCPHLSKGLGPQALCHLHFKGSRCVLNDLKSQNVFPKVTGLSRPGIEGCEIVTGEVTGVVLTGSQSVFERDPSQGLQDTVFPKFFGQILKYRNKILEGKVIHLLKGHVRVFQELVFDDGLNIHDN